MVDVVDPERSESAANGPEKIVVLGKRKHGQGRYGI
jgi:hypothetical protein